MWAVQSERARWEEGLFILDRNILRSEPGEISVPPVWRCTSRQEGKREARQEQWINESMKEREQRLSYFIKLIQKRLELNEYNSKPKHAGREPSCPLLSWWCDDGFHEMCRNLRAPGIFHCRPPSLPKYTDIMQGWCCIHITWELEVAWDHSIAKSLQNCKHPKQVNTQGWQRRVCTLFNGPMDAYLETLLTDFLEHIYNICKVLHLKCILLFV